MKSGGGCVQEMEMTHVSGGSGWSCNVVVTTCCWCFVVDGGCCVGVVLWW